MTADDAHLGADGGSATTAPTPPPNPGGMWTPSQIPAQAELLAAMGYKLSAETLADPTQFPLGAVVSLGGCSGSFVSKSGLVVTNHHCVGRYLQHNSSAERNLLVDGFLAGDRSQELSAGPSARVFVTTAFEDVTAKVLKGLDASATAVERSKHLEDQREALEKACEAGRPEVRCRVASYFEGAQYVRIEQLEIRDVRLVYVPHVGVGNYGGEVDNWRWPRHAGDFAFLRAYVGPDGKPADPSPNNRPYTPPHALEVSGADLDEGDFVMVVGYPGRTSRFRTADEVRYAVDTMYPRRIRRFEQTLAMMHELAELDPELRIKVAGHIAGYGNVLTNNRGTLAGLDKGGLAQAKARQEAALRAWIAEDPARFAEHGGVLDAIAGLNAVRRQGRSAALAEAEIVRSSTLLKIAQLLFEVAEERAENAGKLEDRWLRSRTQKLSFLQKYFDRRIDERWLELSLSRVAELPAAEQPEILRDIIGKGDPQDPNVRKAAITRLLSATRMADARVVQRWFERGTLKSLGRASDPLLVLAKALVEREKANEAEVRRLDGQMSELRPRYVAALRAFHHGSDLAPDANSTLRVTYGTIRGYVPTPDAAPYRPFTTTSGMVAKHTGQEPFAAPSKVLTALQRGVQGNYADPELGELPLNFLSDLDITGGNSGSATLDAEGKLVGLVFDGNYEAMANDWMFLPELTRSIHVDFRYVMWMMDAVDGADHLLREMGIEPSIASPNDTGGPVSRANPGGANDRG